MCIITLVQKGSIQFNMATYVKIRGATCKAFEKKLLSLYHSTNKRLTEIRIHEKDMLKKVNYHSYKATLRFMHKYCGQLFETS